MPPLPIPSSPAALTTEWLTDALRSGGVISSARVSSANVEVIGADRGFAGQVIRVRLEYDPPGSDAAPSLIAKLPAADDTMRSLLAGLGWYANEIHFYEQIAGESAIRTPRRYYSAMDRGRNEYVLLMEDVTTGRIGDQIAGGSAAQAEAVVQHMAEFQSQWWEHPRLDGLSWLAAGAVRPADGADGWQAFYRQAWPIARELMPDVLCGPIVAIGDRLVRGYAAVLRSSAERPRTVIHGDCRLDNVFFSEDGAQPPTFIDWQLVSCGRGAYDLAYFLGTNLTTEVRRAHETALLRRYHSVVTEGRGNGYSFEHCLRDYRLAMLLAFGFWVQTAGAPSFPVSAHPLRDVAMERLSAALIDLDAGQLLHEL